MTLTLTASPPIGRLVDCSVRDAWKHEAHNFTVWLSQNLDRLSEVLGITLELEGTEVQLGSFYADILARNVGAEEGADRVLIENQLEPSDHRHLGQILTYLAGAKVSTVVWVSPDFREEHLSAVKWLNDNTSTGFSFFAIKLRAVRIGDSVIAPLLDVLEKPNDWERQLHATAPAKTGGLTEEGRKTGSFWAAYLARFPADTAFGARQTNLRYNSLAAVPGIQVNIWCSLGNSGVFIKSMTKDKVDELSERLAPHLPTLRQRLGYEKERDSNGLFLLKRNPKGCANEADWPAVADWLHAEAVRYIEALRDIFPEETDPA